MLLIIIFGTLSFPIINNLWIKLGCVQNSKFWGPDHIFGAAEARHFKFGIQTDRNEYYHIHV